MHVTKLSGIKQLAYLFSTHINTEGWLGISITDIRTLEH